jgi:hypothetical protein
LVFLRNGLVRDCRLCVEVGDESFEESDVDRSVFFVEYAVAFALSFVSADAAADRGEVGLTGDDRHGVAEVAAGEFGYPVWNFVAYRATFFARRGFAVEASLSFSDSLGERVALGIFLELFHCLV